MAYKIVPYSAQHRHQILALSLKAWRPVFKRLEPAVQPYVFEAFYPEGWEVRQTSEIIEILQDEPERVWVAQEANSAVGWVGIKLHPDDKMGEVYILAVAPNRQKEGIASALLEKAFEQIRLAGMQMVMVETGDDPGHAASRAVYESKGFERWPVARYFRKL